MERLDIMKTRVGCYSLASRHDDGEMKNLLIFNRKRCGGGKEEEDVCSM